ncbi:MAG: molybdopterin-guanine dinucleotide biosynthesis protein B [Promethearchaeota archaeon]
MYKEIHHALLRGGRAPVECQKLLGLIIRMKILSIVGHHNSGKTTVVESLIKHWTEKGHSIAIIKNIHIESFSLDKPGKDTWRYKQAGAEMVGMCTPIETNILFPKRKPLEEILHYFKTDYLILEGFSQEEQRYPRIVCAREEALILDHLTPLTFAISGIISDKIRRFRDLPVLNAIQNLEALIDLINEHVT